MTSTLVPGTSDLHDEHGDALETCDLQLRNLGGRRHFSGAIVTVRAFEENLIVKEIIGEPGLGRVLVIDTAGSLRVAMLGDNMAARALANGWAGFVVNGAVRDVVALGSLDIGVKALGTNPRRSRKEGGGVRDDVVRFGGATFVPGAWLVSDDDGVVALPA